MKCPRCGLRSGFNLFGVGADTYDLTCGCRVTRQAWETANPGAEPSDSAAPMRVEATYTEPIVAWRGWKWTRIESFDGGQVPELRSVGSNMPWLQRREAAAACSATSYSHEAPQPSCTCGIWSFKDRAKTEAALARYGPQGFVLGEVKLWGRIVETVNGYRAQYAYPKRLYVTDEELAVGLAERYGVPVEVEEAKPLPESDPNEIQMAPGTIQVSGNITIPAGIRISGTAFGGNVLSSNPYWQGVVGSAAAPLTSAQVINAYIKQAYGFPDPQPKEKPSQALNWLAVICWTVAFLTWTCWTIPHWLGAL